MVCNTIQGTEIGPDHVLADTLTLFKEVLTRQVLLALFQSRGQIISTNSFPQYAYIDSFQIQTLVLKAIELRFKQKSISL